MSKFKQLTDDLESAWKVAGIRAPDSNSWALSIALLITGWVIADALSSLGPISVKKED